MTTLIELMMNCEKWCIFAAKKIIKRLVYWLLIKLPYFLMLTDKTESLIVC